ncbi:MAG: hypothetical protein D6798_13265, partial [Deltaproteobacteria bacterium]
AADGTIVPMFQEAPDTFQSGADDSLTNLDDVDAARVLRVFGTGGSFVEADGTTYTVSGSPTETATATETLASGTIHVGGVDVAVEGSTPRTYTVELAP